MALPLNQDQRHVMQASHNEQLLNEAIFPDPCVVNPQTCNYKDWMITVSFYIALHYIHAYLHRKNYRTYFKSHKQRNDYLKNQLSQTDRKIHMILPNYLILYKLSRKSRYIPCYYSYFQPALLCKYHTFASRTLPNKLGLI